MISEVNPGEGAGGLPCGKWSNGHLKKKTKHAVPVSVQRAMMIAEARMNEIFAPAWVTSPMHRDLMRQIAHWLLKGALVVIVCKPDHIDCGPLWPPGEGKK